MTRSLNEAKALYAESIYQIAKYSAIAEEMKLLIESAAKQDAVAILSGPEPQELCEQDSSLSVQQLRILRVIHEHILTSQLVPTYDEVATKVETSKSNARHIIHRLVAKNLLRRAPGRYRNLVVTELGLKAASKPLRRAA